MAKDPLGEYTTTPWAHFYCFRLIFTALGPFLLPWANYNRIANGASLRSEAEMGRFRSGSGGDGRLCPTLLGESGATDGSKIYGVVSLNDLAYPGRRLKGQAVWQNIKIAVRREENLAPRLYILSREFRFSSNRSWTNKNDSERQTSKRPKDGKEENGNKKYV